jgi:outer membrane protein TolC
MAMATLKNASRQDESRRVERGSVSTPGQTGAPLSPMNGSHRRTTSINLKERRLTVVCLLLVVLTGSGIAGQSQFLGSVPTGVPSSTPLALSLREAIDRGLKTNLGLLLRESDNENARGERLQMLSALLPQLDGRTSERAQQLNLKTVGFNFSIPGVSIPTVVGPFHYTDLRAYGTWTAFDYMALKNYSASRETKRASQLSLSDARDLVVQAAANAYLQITADASRVEAIRSQVETSQALYDRAVARQTAGTAAGIDVLRSQVELKQQQQRLLVQANQFEKDKLTLGRVIGIPASQDFNLSETAPLRPFASISQDEALRIALDARSDLQSYQAHVRAAEDAVRAAYGGRYPTAEVTADYGRVGALGELHPTFSVVASATISIFDGGRIAGNVTRARSALKQRQDELADLRGQIEYQVRTALLDLRSSAEQMVVARDNLDLANQTLLQARDRFSAGVSDTVEVVQAQELVATANDTLISAVFTNDAAKVALARALGGTEQVIHTLLEVQ